MNPNKPVEVGQSDLNDIYSQLGKIQGSIEAVEKQHSRTVLALVGVIAAQIGVKVLGTPFLLDISTSLGIVAVVLLMGILFRGWKIFRSRDRNLTKSGYYFTAMMGMILITQIMVYLEDLLSYPINILYIVRILQNASVLLFGWQFLCDPNLFYYIADRKKEEAKAAKKADADEKKALEAEEKATQQS